MAPKFNAEEDTLIRSLACAVDEADIAIMLATILRTLDLFIFFSLLSVVQNRVLHLAELLICV